MKIEVLTTLKEELVLIRNNVVAHLTQGRSGIAFDGFHIVDLAEFIDEKILAAPLIAAPPRAITPPTPNSTAGLISTVVPTKSPETSGLPSTQAPDSTAIPTNRPPSSPTPRPSIRVTKTTDTNDGICDSDCSLREAIHAVATGDKITISGGIGRLQRARKATGLSQEAVANQIGVSWMTVHRWERSQRSISDDLLGQFCGIYDKDLGWFITLEDGDLAETKRTESDTSAPIPTGSEAAQRLCRKIADAPPAHRAMIEKVVEGMLDGLRRAE